MTEDQRHQMRLDKIQARLTEGSLTEEQAAVLIQDENDRHDKNVRNASNN